METVLRTQGLCKHYRRFKALDGLDMEVPKGAIYGLVGKNGAGKTTLIRVVCGLQEPTVGSYTLYGKRWRERELSQARRRMGAVVETPSIYLDMTAADNLKTQYKILGLPSYDGIDEILKLVGLENTGSKKAKNFSLGMRQRLGIAGAAAAAAGERLPDLLPLAMIFHGLRIRSGVIQHCAVRCHPGQPICRVPDAGQIVRAVRFHRRRSQCQFCLKLLFPQIQRLLLLHPLTQIELLQQRVPFLKELNKPQRYIFAMKSAGAY